MIKKYKFKRINSIYWGVNNDADLCFWWLDNLFELDDVPDTIEVVVSSKPSANSYYVKFTGESVLVTLSNGDKEEIVTTYLADRVLRTLPKHFYVSVIA